MIEISGDYGGPKSGKYISLLQARLNDIFRNRKIRVDKYCKTVAELSIILRVSGEITDFDGGDGPERLRFMKKQNYITIDLVIPEKKWKDIDVTSVKSYFEEGIRQSFNLLIKRAKKEKELIDEEGLVSEFNKAMEEFAKLKDMAPHKSVA